MSALSYSISSIADSVHELNLPRRAMFKSALREDFKGSCNENEAVSTPIFVMNSLTHILTETNKVTRQLTDHAKAPSSGYRQAQPRTSPYHHQRRGCLLGSHNRGPGHHLYRANGTTRYQQQIVGARVLDKRWGTATPPE